MEKRGIISTPPNPHKKGGPYVGGLVKKDGEQQQETFVVKDLLPKPQQGKPEEKKE